MCTTSREALIVICMSNRVSIPALLCVIDASGVFVVLFCIVLAAENRIQIIVLLFLDANAYHFILEARRSDKLRLIVGQTYSVTSVVPFTTNDSYFRLFLLSNIFRAVSGTVFSALLSSIERLAC